MSEVAPPPATQPSPKIVLLDAGAAPRSARSYAFVKGRTDKRIVTVRQSAAREGEQAREAAAYALTVELTPRAVELAGAKMELRVVKITVPDAKGAERMKAEAQLAPLVGITGAFDISPRGEVGAADFTLDEKLAGPGSEVFAQSLQQALDLVVAPLPSEPIGVGAKWERTIDSKGQGQESRVTHAFTLTEVAADGGVVTADVVLAMQKHPLVQKGVPAGATEEASAKGAYRYAFKLDHVATKVTGEISITRRIEVPGSQGGPRQSFAEIVTLKNALETPK